MRRVGAYEAKTKLAELLDEVEGGRAIVITRHGKAVAELVPIGRGASPLPLGDIVETFRRLRKGRKLGIPIKEAIAAGRR
ncbi:MAG: type II toxin-antitoxin system prevent-host-death family antitoxin [Rhodospirillales bacterium]|nr:type II toxin-antitoxin system prevent-host-death family antitoxin [Rhodospirillales bacterium]